MILRICSTLLLASLLILSAQCKEEPSSQAILKIQDDKTLDLQSAMAKILPMVFPHLLKDWSLEQDPKTSQWKLIISYGGSTALTFSSQKEYLENTIRSHSMYNARLVAAISSLPIQEIRLSLTKPLYVKGENHPDVGIQEFEIYRTSLQVEQAKLILKESPDISPFSDFKHQKVELIALFDKIHKTCTSELDQLRLITVE